MIKRIKNLRNTRIITALLIFGSVIFSAACEEKRTPSRFLIPKDYVGWVQVDFEVKDAPPVTLEDGRFFFKFPSSGRIQTSSKQEFGWASDDYYFYSGENREAIKETSSGNGGLIWGGGTGSNDSSANFRHIFVGTEEQFKKCGIGNEQKIRAFDEETLKNVWRNKIMKRTTLKTILLVGIFAIFGLISANAQTNVSGKYVLEQKFDNGQTRQIAFELKDDNSAVYSKVNAALEESTEKSGSWEWDRSKKFLTVTMPAENNEKAVVVTFKMSGKNLKVVKISPKDAGKIGDVFKKIQK